jgi:hypothetical protein
MPAQRDPRPSRAWPLVTMQWRGGRLRCGNVSDSAMLSVLSFGVANEEAARFKSQYVFCIFFCHLTFRDTSHFYPCS